MPWGILRWCSPLPRPLVIIGGVAGGMSAATRLRRLNETAQIIVVERSGYVWFPPTADCPITWAA